MKKYPFYANIHKKIDNSKYFAHFFIQFFKFLKIQK